MLGQAGACAGDVLSKKNPAAGSVLFYRVVFHARGPEGRSKTMGVLRDGKGSFFAREQLFYG